MALANMDLTSDTLVFFGSMFIIAIVLAVLLERVSPKRQKRRRIDRRGNKSGGELID